MSFPNTPLIDDFTGADVNPAPNWSVIFPGNAGTFQRISNQGQDDGFTVASEAYHTASFCTPNCEAWMTISVVPVLSGNRVRLYARISGQDPPFTPTAPNYYAVSYVVGTPNIVAISKYFNGSFGDLTTFTQTISNGDKIGIQCIDSAISAYYYTSGKWSRLGGVTDTDIGQSGYLGAATQHNAENPRIDNFGGGGIRATAASPVSLAATTGGRW